MVCSICFVMGVVNNSLKILINTAHSLSIALSHTSTAIRSSHRHQIMEIQRLFGEHQSDPEQILSLLLVFLTLRFFHSLINTRMRFVQHHTIVEFFRAISMGFLSPKNTKNVLEEIV